MKAYIAECIGGILALNERCEAIYGEPFAKDVATIVERLAKLERGELIDELRNTCFRLLEGGIEEIVVEDEELARNIAKSFPSLRVRAEAGSAVIREFRRDIWKFMSIFGLEREECLALLREVSISLTRVKVSEAAEKRDLFIAHSISAIDEVNKTLNILSSRIREWYGLHFPELNELVKEHEDIIRMVYELGDRGAFEEGRLIDLGVQPSKARKIERAAKGSMGAEMADIDLKAIRSLAGITLNLYELRKELESYADEAMKEVAPNVRGIVGPLLGARLIALAGGLRKLAALPSSTVQVLGAEKALFRALRSGAKPPKHGVIFQCSEIFKAPKWQRGKIARALAGKLSIAAKVDLFSGEYIADELREKLNQRIDEIKKLYAKPPIRRKERKARGSGDVR